jgi:hypothetical protein
MFADGVACARNRAADDDILIHNSLPRYTPHPVRLSKFVYRLGPVFTKNPCQKSMSGPIY